MKLLDHIVKLTGDIYITKRPMFLVYKPELHLVKGHEIRALLKVISPGDILLRKYKGYLNAILTGGLYSHGALYIGHNTVIHATSKGIHEEDLLDFCRADSLCCLTVPNGNPQAAIKTAQSLLGKKYDYSFKSNNKKYYCTEMVDVAYNGVFAKDYEDVYGNIVLLPDAIRFSHETKVVIEILH